MFQIHKNLKALVDDLVTFLVPDIDDKADAASVVLVAGVIKSLRKRKPVLVVRQLLIRH